MQCHATLLLCYLCRPASLSLCYIHSMLFTHTPPSLLRILLPTRMSCIFLLRFLSHVPCYTYSCLLSCCFSRLALSTSDSDSFSSFRSACVDCSCSSYFSVSDLVTVNYGCSAPLTHSYHVMLIECSFQIPVSTHRGLADLFPFLLLLLLCLERICGYEIGYSVVWWI